MLASLSSGQKYPTLFLAQVIILNLKIFHLPCLGWISALPSLLRRELPTFYWSSEIGEMFEILFCETCELILIRVTLSTGGDRDGDDKNEIET